MNEGSGGPYQTAVIGQAQGINQNLSKLVQVMSKAYPINLAAAGTFTMPAANTKTVTDGACSSSSYVFVSPSNAAAGTLEGSAKKLFVTSANGSFTANTSSGAAAAGTENFFYLIINI